jgi:hypothetical protein
MMVWDWLGMFLWVALFLLMMPVPPEKKEQKP